MCVCFKKESALKTQISELKSKLAEAQSKGDKQLTQKIEFSMDKLICMIKELTERQANLVIGYKISSYLDLNCTLHIKSFLF